MGRKRKEGQRRGRLEHLTDVIKSGEQAFIKVGEALAEVRENRLYESDYESYDDYCREELGYSGRHGDRRIRASHAAKVLRPIGLDIQNESQARVMARMMDDPETAKRIWDRVGEKTGGKHTAAKLARAVQQELGTQSPDPYYDYYLEDEDREDGGAQERGQVANRKRNVHFSSDSDEWDTPGHIVERVKRALGGDRSGPVRRPREGHTGYLTLHERGRRACAGVARKSVYEPALRHRDRALG